MGTSGLTFEYLNHSDSNLAEYYKEMYGIDVSEFGNIAICLCYEQDM